MARRSSHRTKAIAIANSAKRVSAIRELIRTRVMVGATIFTSLLISTFTAYGMLSGDRELLSEVWLLVKIVTLTLIAWGGGQSLLRVLSRLRLEDDTSDLSGKVASTRRIQ